MITASESDERTDLAALRIGGTEVQYYVYCPRRLWWYSHGMQQEHSGGTPGSEYVAQGKVLHETAYPEQRRKDILIDDLLRIDFTESGAIHEIKKSKGGQKAALYQLLYYLYYLKHEKGVETTGVIDYPTLKRRDTVTLTPEYEADIVQIIEGVRQTRELAMPPAVAEPMPICRKCAYQELCWG